MRRARPRGVVTAGLFAMSSDVGWAEWAGCRAGGNRDRSDTHLGHTLGTRAAPRCPCSPSSSAPRGSPTSATTHPRPGLRRSHSGQKRISGRADCREENGQAGCGAGSGNTPAGGEQSAAFGSPFPRDPVPCHPPAAGQWSFLLKAPHQNKNKIAKSFDKRFFKV